MTTDVPRGDSTAPLPFGNQPSAQKEVGGFTFSPDGSCATKAVQQGGRSYNVTVTFPSNTSNEEKTRRLLALGKKVVKVVKNAVNLGLGSPENKPQKRTIQSIRFRVDDKGSVQAKKYYNKGPAETVRDLSTTAKQKDETQAPIIFKTIQKVLVKALYPGSLPAAERPPPLPRREDRVLSPESNEAIRKVKAQLLPEDQKKLEEKLEDRFAKAELVAQDIPKIRHTVKEV